MKKTTLLLLSLTLSATLCPLRCVAQHVDYWRQFARLNPSGAGASVSLSDSTAVVGAPSEGVGGVAYVYSETPNGIRTAMLTASDTTAGDYFGYLVVISGDSIAVAALNAETGRGKIYVFVEPPTGWTDMTETAQLTASDGVAGDSLGVSLGFSGDTVVAGARLNRPPATEYLFVKSPMGWANATENAQLTQSDGTNFDTFGVSAAVNANTVVVGAPMSNSGHGAAYIYVEPKTGWTNMTQTAKLTPGSGKVNMGSSVAISGSTVAAGAQATSGYAGGVYVFVKPKGGWKNTATPNAILTIANSGNGGHHLGYSVSISGDTIMSGAPYYPCVNPKGQGCRGEGPGAVFGFAKPPGGWINATQDWILMATNGTPGAQFGSSISVSGQVAIASTISAAREYAFQYISNAGFTTFAEPTSSNTIGTGVNNLDQIVGDYTSADCGQSDCGFLLNDGVFTSITYPAASATYVFGINDGGEIVGGYRSGNTEQGFTDQNGTFVTVNYPGSNYTYLSGINLQGDIVGTYATSDNSFGQGFLYSGGVFTPVEVPGAEGTTPVGINSSGEIIGYYCIAPCQTTASSFLYRDGTFTDVKYPGAAYTLVRGINDNGDIVGIWYDSKNQLQGSFVYWNTTHQFINFNIGGVGVGLANGINNAGEIVGQLSQQNITYGFYGHLPGH